MLLFATGDDDDDGGDGGDELEENGLFASRSRGATGMNLRRKF